MVNVSFTEYETDVLIAALMKTIDDIQYADSKEALRMKQAMLNAAEKAYSSLNETAQPKTESCSVRKCEAVRIAASGKTRKILKKKNSFYILVD